MAVVLAVGLEANPNDVLLWTLHMKLYKDGPLTKRRVDRAAGLTAYVKAALKYRSDCYSLWQAGIQASVGHALAKRP
eukprot:scaffold141919_cov32-Prasinocladus_malaysianus.AAC.1